MKAEPGICPDPQFDPRLDPHIDRRAVPSIRVTLLDTAAQDTAGQSNCGYYPSEFTNLQHKKILLDELRVIL
jgi:hypothetical protein